MTQYLGEFEQVVLLAILRQGGEAHGSAVYDEIVGVTRRRPSLPSIYVTLSRLERKGYVKTRDIRDTERESRARKLFTLTRSGARELRRSRELFDQLWQGVEWQGGL